MAFSVNLLRLRPQLLDELLNDAGVALARERVQLQLFAAGRLVPGTVNQVEPEYHITLLLLNAEEGIDRARASASFGPAPGSQPGAGPFARLPRHALVNWIQEQSNRPNDARARSAQ